MSNKKMTALILCVFFGYLGIHRFYAKKTLSGIVYLLTAGAFGVGWVIDIFLILFDKFGLEEEEQLQQGDHSYTTNAPTRSNSEFAPFSNDFSMLTEWDSRIHADYQQHTRQDRAIYGGMEILNVDIMKLEAVIKSDNSYGTIYHTTLRDCSCPDFQNRHAPCKHMYLLNYKLLSLQKQK